MIFLTLLFLLTKIFAYSEITNIEAKSVTFQQDTWIFEDQTTIENPIGSILSKQVKITRDQEGEFSSLQLQDESFIHFMDSSKISCDKAFIDLRKQKAVFSSTHQVLYQDQIEEVTLNCLATEFNCHFDQNKLHSFWGKGSVSLHFQKYHLLSDYIYYQKESELAFAWRKSPAKCLFWHNDDEFQADQFIIKGPLKEVEMINPSGHTFFGRKKVEIKSKHMLFKDHVFSLKRDVQILEKTMKFVSSLVEIEENTSSFPHKIYSLKAQKGGVLSVLLQGHPLHMICSGPITLDRNDGVLHAISEPSSPIELKYKHLTINGNEVDLTFDESDHDLSPTLIRLMGNIRLSWQLPSQDHREIMATADEISFHPILRCVILTAELGGEVHIWEELEEMEMMAKQISITTVKNNSYPSIQVDGNAKMLFHPREKDD